MLTKITVGLEVEGYKPQSLSISFQRNVGVGVSDNADVNKLPPGLGSFPLYSVKDYASTLPPHMLAKGECFFPMYRKFSTSTDDDQNQMS